MIELMLVVCLANSPTSCHQERPAFQMPFEHALACMREGMFRVVEWQNQHPGWEVRRWSCRPPEA